MNGRPHQIDDWFAQLAPDRRDEAQALAEQIRAATGELDGGGLAEAIKWNRLTFTAGGDWHHWLCAVSVTPRAVSLMFHKGALLDDPDGLLRGDGQYLRSMPFGRAQQRPDAVTALLRQALSRQTDMLDSAG